METSDVRNVRHAHKRHICDWCGQRIEAGAPYETWFTFGECVTTRMHPECYEAQCVAVLYDEELPPRGTYRRGCSCGEDEEHCACKKALTGGEE